MGKILLTKQGALQLKKELDRLIHEERPHVIEELVEARESNSSPDSVGYQRAVEVQQRIEQRIMEIESKLSSAEIIDPKNQIQTDEIHIGATVVLKQAGTNGTVEYKIVGDEESNVAAGKISVNSPIASSLLGRQEDDTVVVDTPGGERSFDIISVKYE